MDSHQLAIMRALTACSATSKYTSNLPSPVTSGSFLTQIACDCSAACITAIAQIETVYDECRTVSGLSDDLLPQIQAVCGVCSPKPELDFCGIVNRSKHTSILP